MAAVAGDLLHDLATEDLRVQQDRLRRRLCILCGEAHYMCGCREYERFDERPLEGMDAEGTA